MIRHTAVNMNEYTDGIKTLPAQYIKTGESCVRIGMTPLLALVPAF